MVYTGESKSKSEAIQESKTKQLRIENLESFSAQGNSDIATMQIVRICNMTTNTNASYLQVRLAIINMCQSKGKLLKCLSLEDLAKEIAANIKNPEGPDFKNFLIESLVKTICSSLDPVFINEIIYALKRKMDKVLVIRRTLTDTIKAIYRESNTAMDEILRKQAETIAARERMSKIIRTKPKAI